MDACELVVECPLVRGHLEGEEVPPRDGVYLVRCRNAFAEMQQHAAILFFETSEERPSVLGVHIGDAAHCLWELWVVCLLNIAHNASVEALYARVACEFHALTRGDSS